MYKKKKAHSMAYSGAQGVLFVSEAGLGGKGVRVGMRTRLPPGNPTGWGMYRGFPIALMHRKHRDRKLVLVIVDRLGHVMLLVTVPADPSKCPGTVLHTIPVRRG